MGWRIYGTGEGKCFSTREQLHAVLQYAASFHCLVDCEELEPQSREILIFVDKKREETKRRTEWCVAAGK